MEYFCNSYHQLMLFSEIKSGPAAGAPSRQLDLLLSQQRIVGHLSAVREIARVEFRYSLQTNHFLDLLLPRHKTNHFPHKIKLVLIQQLEAAAVQGQTSTAHEQSTPTTRLIPQQLLTRLLQQRHRVGIAPVGLLQPIQPGPPVIEQLFLQRRLEQQVVVVVL